MAVRSSVLFSAVEIERRVTELAAAIRHDYAGLGEPLLVLGLLKGSFVFLADLIRAAGLPVEIDFVYVSSYGVHKVSAGEVKVILDAESDVAGRHVLLVEDIIDTGHTLAFIRRRLLGRHPASLRICVLLDKTYRREEEVPVDYCGFRFEQGFVVGYGIDYAGQYRHLPEIRVLEEAG